MIEQAENNCLKYCIGACCRNVALFNVTAQELALFPEAVQKLTADDAYDRLFEFQGPRSEGVYSAIDREGRGIVGIRGDCPNLLPGGECGIYDVRPDACRNLVVNGQVCNNTRKKAGLRPLEKIAPN